MTKEALIAARQAIKQLVEFHNEPACPAFEIGEEALALIESALSDDVKDAERWVPVTERMPEPGTDCLVYVKGHFIDSSYIDRDTWRMQREAPVSFSTMTVETGLAWDDHEFEEITHWMPLPPPPAAAQKGAV